jgi:TonB family protein
VRLSEAGLLRRRERRWDKSFDVLDPIVQSLAADQEKATRREMRLGLVAAAFLHLVIFAIVFPSFEMEVRETASRRRVYRLQQVRFQPPKPQVKQVVSKPRARRIPIPDPTPDEPEPLFEEVELLEGAEFPATDVGVAIPDGPPAPGEQVFQLRGDVIAPVRTHAPQPVYPEDARQARVQGVVILQTIIDALGNVTDVRVLKGLPSGLTEAAIEAVSSWQFKPATMDGRPVPVYYMVTVTFNLQ